MNYLSMVIPMLKEVDVSVNMCVRESGRGMVTNMPLCVMARQLAHQVVSMRAHGFSALLRECVSQALGKAATKDMRLETMGLPSGMTSEQWTSDLTSDSMSLSETFACPSQSCVHARYLTHLSSGMETCLDGMFQVKPR